MFVTAFENINIYIYIYIYMDKDFLHTRLQQLLHTGTDVKQKKRHICKVMCSAHDEY